MHVVFEPNNFTPAELQQGMISAFSDFYSYTQSINEALNVVLESAVILIKKVYSYEKIPSLIPTLIKLFGQRIAKNWINYNQGYLAYLNKIVSENSAWKKHNS